MHNKIEQDLLIRINQEGAQAGYLGETLDQCPYRYGTLSYEVWLDGFANWIEFGNQMIPQPKD